VFRRVLEAHIPVGHILAHLYFSELLNALVPEFADLTCAPQFDLYHKYTIDAHSLLTVAELDRLMGGHTPRRLEPFRVLLESVVDLAPLRFALLLHDSGKPHGRDHARVGAEIAIRAAERLGFGSEAVDDIGFLVRHHLLLSKATQQRDIQAPELVKTISGIVGTRRRLNRLFLVTFADMRCVSEGVWTGWKEEQLWSLYRNVVAYLEERTRDQTDFRRQLALYHPGQTAPLSRDAVEQHVQAMQWPDYDRVPFRRILRHAELALAHDRGSVEVRIRALSEASRLSVVCEDRSGLFPQVVGALTGAGTDIVQGACYTRRDGLVIDEFEVLDTLTGRPLDPEREARTVETVRHVLEGRVEVRDLLARKRRTFPDKPPSPRAVTHVTVDNRTSQHCSVLDIQAPSRTGLLFDLGTVLEHHGLDIRFVKIGTNAGQAVDTFYVLERSGGKLTDADAEALVAALHETLTRHPPDSGAAPGPPTTG
jgi:[protein-PII] uridylyltransferase